MSKGIHHVFHQRTFNENSIEVNNSTPDFLAIHPKSADRVAEIYSIAT